MSGQSTSGHAHGHDHGHDPGHGHSHGIDRANLRQAQRRRLLLVLCLVLGYAIVEAVGGWLTGSLALLADSLHMVSDVAALGLSLLAVWMAALPASRRRTFGNSRAEILAALANGVALAVVALFIAVHAVERIFAPSAVEGEGVMWVAAGGLAINLIALYVLEGGRNDSLNVRGAWLHVLSDTLASVGVILAGAGIWAFGWTWLDPAISLVVSALVLVSGGHLIREALDVLMETAPSHLDPEEIQSALLATPGVESVHCLHVWTIGSGEISLSSHLVVDPGQDLEALLPAVRGALSERFAIAHTTLQLEPRTGAEDPDCADACDPVPASA